MKAARFPQPSRELSRTAAIVGVGTSDFGEDYRAGRQKDPAYVPPDDVSLATVGFERALADAGLRRADIDGLFGCFIYGNPDLPALADALGIKPRYAITDGYLDDAIPAAVVALASGACDTIALVYAAAPRGATKRVFGGATYAEQDEVASEKDDGEDDEMPTSYYYFTPWGWSSQAAHWAFLFQHYMNTFAATEADLGHVAMTLRRHAGRNDNAIMRTPLTIDDYLSSRYIVRPMHLLDMCLVNNGAVCLILRQSDLSSGLAQVPVEVAGWGHAKSTSAPLDNLVRGRMREQYEASLRQALEMAGLGRSHVGHFQGYDASSIHLVQQLEGYGFTEPGTGLAFCKDGGMDLGGALPTNTNGGLLSEAYMHGWNNVVESVRQLRHELGARQVESVTASLFSFATTEAANPLLLTRGG